MKTLTALRSLSVENLQSLLSFPLIKLSKKQATHVLINFRWAVVGLCTASFPVGSSLQTSKDQRHDPECVETCSDSDHRCDLLCFVNFARDQNSSGKTSETAHLFLCNPENIKASNLTHCETGVTWSGGVLRADSPPCCWTHTGQECVGCLFDKEFCSGWDCGQQRICVSLVF